MIGGTVLKINVARANCNINWANAPADNLLVAYLQPLGLDIELMYRNIYKRGLELVRARPPPTHIHA
jgi:hypothetical protein